jgi:hypothetical protein
MLILTVVVVVGVAVGFAMCEIRTRRESRRTVAHFRAQLNRLWDEEDKQP